tara:strand:+ start:63 stop:242 length:180 start_codon:yes stop_codon:yes gene_type:complete
MKTVNKYTDYLFEIMQDHYENNKSIYEENGNDTTEWQKIDRMNNKIMKIIKDYFTKQQA